MSHQQVVLLPLVAHPLPHHQAAALHLAAVALHPAHLVPVVAVVHQVQVPAQPAPEFQALAVAAVLPHQASLQA